MGFTGFGFWGLGSGGSVDIAPLLGLQKDGFGGWVMGYGFLLLS